MKNAFTFLFRAPHFSQLCIISLFPFFIILALVIVLSRMHFQCTQFNNNMWCCSLSSVKICENHRKCYYDLESRMLCCISSILSSLRKNFSDFCSMFKMIKTIIIVMICSKQSEVIAVLEWCEMWNMEILAVFHFTTYLLVFRLLF